MKTLKILVASLFVLGFFFVSTDLNAQEKWGKSGKSEMQVEFICPYAGEYLQGTLVVHENENGKVTHLTMKGRKLIGIVMDEFGKSTGVPSGNVYMFTRVDHDNSNTDSGVWIIRTIRLSDGIVTRVKVYL